MTEKAEQTMIDAEFSQMGDSLCLKICGHAAHPSLGGNIVCAAVSGIFYALLGYASNECRSLKINELCPGHADIECSGDGETAMKLTYIGLLQIAATYPESISVKESVWGLRVSGKCV